MVKQKSKLSTHLCECGCGKFTMIGRDSQVPNKFLHGHGGKQYGRDKVSQSDGGNIFPFGNIPWNKTSGIWFRCLWCKKLVRVIPSRKTTAEFCSRSCLMKYRKKHDNSVLQTEFKKGRIPWNKGLNKSNSVYAKNLSKIRQQENNPAWKGGLSRFPYSGEWTPILKAKIRKRDNFTCQMSGMTEAEHLKKHGIILSVHHIDYNKMNCKEDNLITLSVSWNFKVNKNRKYWTKYFQELMKEKKN